MSPYVSSYLNPEYVCINLTIRPSFENRTGDRTGEALGSVSPVEPVWLLKI